MAADFMARRAQFRNSLLAFALACIACNRPQAPVPGIQLNANTAGLHLVAGKLLHYNNVFTGTVFTLYGATSDTAQLACYVNGKEHGEWKKFYQPKKLKERRSFANGQKTGEYLAWWPNGRRQLQYFFKADEYNGTCREWNEKGRLTRVMNYKKGYEDGHQQWWYDNGKVKANYIIKAGRRYGLLGTKNCVNVSDSVFKK